MGSHPDAAGLLLGDNVTVGSTAFAIFSSAEIGRMLFRNAFRQFS